MPFLIKKAPDTSEKLQILSRDSRYDLACACGTSAEEHRRRSADNKWIYPVVLPDGRRTYLFKTLLSNVCVNDCAYCPLRAGTDTARCTLKPEELAGTFLSYYRAGKVSGLFLSSGVILNPDLTMESINKTAQILRRSQFKGYLHLKIIPGASEAAIRHTLSLASAVSLNIETAGKDNFNSISSSKDYEKDILRPIQLISRLTQKGSEFAGIKQTTQFIIGAAQDKDKEIIKYSWKLYKELNLSRIYFSAYQRGAGSASLPGEKSTLTNSQLLTREHRLYQADWLIRKYGFSADEIPLDSQGNLHLEADPKEVWAKVHPEFFPVNLNKADEKTLMRVPGLGQLSVSRILEFRRKGIKLRSLNEIKKINKTLMKAEAYATY
ncbi:MAG: helix-hairpin-helix domain-containing protein [Candidatus Omnitrophica bacterium]|nr:helix-hairpin-helix domain-containing protein [Candidatus Omnitrophota bacterium]